MRIELIGHACHVIECGRTRLTIDPWLTDRLDRFWCHWPAIGDWRRACTSDAVLISHHHFDHHHFPSLAKLDRSTRVYFPRAFEAPKFQGSGMGHQAISWTLHAVGLSEQTQLDAMEWLTIGDLRILPLPSRVHFPEVAFLIEGDGACVYFGGDTMLHPTTQAYFAENKRRVDVAFIPSHSIAPMEPLLLRCHALDYDAIRMRSLTNFDAHCDMIGAEMTVPSSFGWRVEAVDETDDFAWVNHVLFPFSQRQALARLRERGRSFGAMLPGDVIEVGRSKLALHSCKHETTVDEICDEIELLPPPEIPTLRPETSARSSNAVLVRKLLHELCGSEYWYRSVHDRRATSLTVVGDEAETPFTIRPWLAEPVEAVSAADPALSHTVIGAGTLSNLLDSTMLITSAFGLWSGDDELLSAVFHEPRFYCEHLRQRLLKPQRAQGSELDS